MGKLIDLAGLKFGRLTVISLAPMTTRIGRWHCICDCGNTTVSDGRTLRNGTSSSCGCYHREEITNRATMRSIAAAHALGYADVADYLRAKRGAYQSWTGLRSRCNNPKNPEYHYYGGRGITVCARWDRIDNFLADMGARPSPRHSIDRKDVNGDYSPDNCRWATKPEQSNNRRNTIFLSHAGATKPLADWSREIGIPHGVLRHRINRGWSPEKCLTTPVKSCPASLWSRSRSPSASRNSRACSFTTRPAAPGAGTALGRADRRRGGRRQCRHAVPLARHQVCKLIA